MEKIGCGKKRLMYEYKLTEVIKVVDGDTLDVMIDVGFNMFRKERIRINRIDTPESITKDEHEKKFGLEAKNYVSEWIKKQAELTIKTFKDDKYGRILADIYGNNGECLNDLLIKNGFAWEYDGTTKVKNFELLLERRKNNEH
jgi:micrococcal nuclease